MIGTIDAEPPPPRAPAAPVPARSLLEAVAHWVLEVLFWLKSATLALAVVFVLIEVFARYVLNSSIGSTENVLVLLFVWMIFLGLPQAIWDDAAPRVSLFESGALDGRIHRIRRDVMTGVELAYFVYVIVSYVASGTSQFSIKLEPLGWDQFVATIPIPVGCGIAALLLCAKRADRTVTWAGVLSVLAGAAAVVVVLVALGGSVATGVVLLLALLALGAPIAVALGIGAVAMIGVSSTLLPVASAQLLGGASNLALLALPLFMLMGGIVSKTRLSRGLERFVTGLVGWLPGGSGVADILASGIFANMTGNSTADTAAMGSVFIPQMVGSGQLSAEEAAGVQAAAGSIGVVFPPAITMIIFASIAGANVVGVFKATVVPAVLLMVVMAGITIYLKRHAPRRRGGPRMGEIARSVPGALPVLAIPVILDVGIFSGVFAPFESGAVAVALLTVYLLVSRSVGLGQLRQGLEVAYQGITLAMFILVNVSILDYALTSSGASTSLATFARSVGTNRLVVLIVINLIFLVIHTMVDVIASILVLVPLMLPAVAAAHISLFQFAAVIGINSTIGVVLPPLGIGLYVAAGIAGVEPRSVVRRIWPYVTGSLVVLVMVCAIPALSLAL